MFFEVFLFWFVWICPLLGFCSLLGICGSLAFVLIFGFGGFCLQWLFGFLRLRVLCCFRAVLRASCDCYATFA